jgi:hypothetical protein
MSSGVLTGQRPTRGLVTICGQGWTRVYRRLVDRSGFGWFSWWSFSQVTVSPFDLDR